MLPNEFISRFINKANKNTSLFFLFAPSALLSGFFFSLDRHHGLLVHINITVISVVPFDPNSVLHKPIAGNLLLFSVVYVRNKSYVISSHFISNGFFRQMRMLGKLSKRM